MSYDTWDAAIDAAREAGRELGRTVAGWKDVPEGDAAQLATEAADAFQGAAVNAFWQARHETSRVSPYASEEAGQ